MQARLHEPELAWVLQAEQLGTGHAVAQAMPGIPDDANVLVLYGDTPLITITTLQLLLQTQPVDGIGLLTVTLPNPTGYGRILRVNEQVVGIVEQKDASPEQQAITEVNTGVLVAPAKQMKEWLSGLTNQNAQGEYYLTDVIAAAHQAGSSIQTAQPSCVQEVEGANNRLQLAQPEGWSTLVVVLAGTVQINDGTTLGAAEMASLSTQGTQLTLAAQEDAKLLLLAGEPIAEPVVGYGPFVMNSEQQIAQAIDDFNRGHFTH